MSRQINQEYSNVWEILKFPRIGVNWRKQIPIISGDLLEKLKLSFTYLKYCWGDNFPKVSYLNPKWIHYDEAYKTL